MRYQREFAAADAATIQALGSIPSGGPDVAGLMSSERNNFSQAFNGAEGAGQDVLTYGKLLSRNITISNIAQQMTAQNNQVIHGPKDTATRQAEINEWQAQNKLDTLFFLQILFLFFTVTVILIFLQQWGVLPRQIFTLIIGILAVIVIGVLWNRASYTSQSRDKRHWNRRYLGLSDSGISAETQCSNTGLTAS